VSAPRLGLLIVVLTAVTAVLAFTKDVPFLGDPYEIRAAFEDSSGIRAGSPVRIAGVQVGEVTDVAHTSPGSRTVTLTMSVADRGRPVHADATAKIRPRIFLEGNFYVELSPGSPGAPELGEGEALPVEQTANPVQLDEVLQALRGDTRAALQRTLTELGETQAAGGGRAFNRSLRYQADAYRYSAIVSEALLGERPGDLARLLREGGTVAAALDRSPRRLRSLVADLATTAGALADRQADLRAAVDELPETLRAGLPALAAVNAALPDVRRFARAARPGIRSTGPTARALLPLLRDLRGLVGDDELRGLSRDLRRATPPLADVTAESPAVLEQLRRAASCVEEVLVPWGDARVPDAAHPATGPVFNELPKSFSGLAGESRSFDANGQVFKILAAGGTTTYDLGGGRLYPGPPGLRTNPPADRTRPPLRPDVACETQEPPDLATVPGPGPRVVPIDPADPAVLTRTARARAVAAAFAEADLRAVGDDATEVRPDALATPGLVASLPRLSPTLEEGRAR
jgi:virulence factor Mce-like protein